MPATVTVTDNTVQADNILLKLDELAKGYDEVLAMAKQQLENFEITESDWNRICDKLSRKIDHWDLAHNLRAQLGKGLLDLRNNEDSPTEDARFARTLSGHILDRLEQRVKSYLLTHAVSEQIEAQIRVLREDLVNLIDQRIPFEIEREAFKRANDATAQKRMLQDLLKSCFGQELHAIVVDAVQEVTG